MEFFLDTASLDEIREAARWGVVTGVTTNPTLMAREGEADFADTIKRIADLIDGPISAEVVSVKAADMVEEARPIARWHPNVVVKIPIIPDGLEAMKILSSEGTRINATLIFSANQALLAARAGASIVSPFIGRLDDVSEDGMQVVRDTVEIFRNYGIATRVLAASIRHPRHVTEAAKAGAHIATMPLAVLKQIMRHPLTDSGLERFLKDWERYQQARRGGKLPAARA
ncbi:MAG: fructose-6-phosphate aldolase [Candidatus Rokubacteria bacterium RIFCSPLOWO2_12_FULL_69_21]|nr:MAG: fructose-6-phosphate aldolase [Candidatus Rokubacteria bacterium RIFCSPLOWO2_12_FULL_69_21]